MGRRSSIAAPLVVAATRASSKNKSKASKRRAHAPPSQAARIAKAQAAASSGGGGGGGGATKSAGKRPRAVPERYGAVRCAKRRNSSAAKRSPPPADDVLAEASAAVVTGLFTRALRADKKTRFVRSDVNASVVTTLGASSPHSQRAGGAQHYRTRSQAGHGQPLSEQPLQALVSQQWLRPCRLRANTAAMQPHSFTSTNSLTCTNSICHTPCRAGRVARVPQVNRRSAPAKGPFGPRSADSVSRALLALSFCALRSPARTCASVCVGHAIGTTAVGEQPTRPLIHSHLHGGGV
jgi:hypothetical protein